MAIRLSTTDLDAAAENLWRLLISGDDDETSKDKMGLDSETYTKVKVHMLDEKSRALRALPTEHVYVQYILDQAENIRELSDMIGTFKTNKQYNAMVGAVRLRADLHDRILTKGQECGIIHRQPERKELVAGVLIGDLSNNQLRRTLVGELSAINGMMELHGDTKFIDVEGGPTHHGPRLKKQKQGKKTKKKQRMVAKQ